MQMKTNGNNITDIPNQNKIPIPNPKGRPIITPGNPNNIAIGTANLRAGITASLSIDESVGITIFPIATGGFEAAGDFKFLNDSPHDLQKLLSSGFSVPHLPQNIIL